MSIQVLDDTGVTQEIAALAVDDEVFEVSVLAAEYGSGGAEHVLYGNGWETLEEIVTLRCWGLLECAGTPPSS